MELPNIKWIISVIFLSTTNRVLHVIWYYDLLGRVLTTKYYLEILSGKTEEILFFIEKTRSSSNDSQHYLKILSKNAGQHRRQHEHGANIGLRTAVLWACLAQFMLLFALDKPHSVYV